MTSTAARQAVDALTADGGIVRIRPVSPDDRAALVAMYERSGPDGLRMRFFAPAGRAVIANEVTRLCRPADPRHDVLVAEIGGALVGVASYERTNEADRTAEFALFVDDDHRGHGIGTLLLEHLSARARAAGVDELLGEVLPQNIRMMRVARDLSGHAWSRFDDGVMDVGLRTRIDETDLRLVDDRERVAERASLRPVLAPAAVAVVGASRKPGGIGHETLRAIKEYGFAGPLYAVNPHAGEVTDVPAYASLRELPGPVDLVVVAVPAGAVRDVLSDAAAAGARAAVVLGSGFGEAGEDGKVRERELIDLARRHGIRLVGPNCIGVLNTDPAVRLNASFIPAVPPRGGLAVASQSGAVGIALLDHAIRSGCGVSTFVSLGNKADVSGNDLIAYWFDDPNTRAVALYLESFGNPRKFARTVRALARRKPVLAVKSGRSSAGRRAGASHTAAAAAPDATVDALFEQAGVVRADNLGELLDAARMLTDQPLPAGGRLGIVGNAGGCNVLAADAAEGSALSVPAPGPALRRALAGAVPRAVAYDNPLDLGAAAAPAAFAAAAEAFAASGDVDVLLIVLAATRTNDVPRTLDALAPVLDRYPALAVAVVVIGADAAPVLGARRAPVFDLPERAVRAVDHAARYAAWRREPLGSRPQLSAVDVRRGRAVVDRALAGDEGWQPYATTAELLHSYGIPLVASVLATDVGAAITAARVTGYPVVLKSADPDLVHKTEVGGVRVNLINEEEVRAAYVAVTSVGRAAQGALVQPMVRGAVELVAGVVHDPLFGSVVMAGLGGVHTDLFGDRALRMVPLTDLDAGRMWRSLRAAPLLTGFRGAPPANTTAVEDLLLRIGALAEDVPEVAELDLNPVLVDSDGAVAVDAKLRLQRVGPEPDADLRRLGSR